MTAPLHGGRLRGLVEHEPVAAADHQVLGPLQRLCRVTSRELGATGVGVSLMWGEDGRVLVAASDEDSTRLEELQFLVGEGPCRQAYALNAPVAVPDLSSSIRFPAYGVHAMALGVHAAFAFPIWEGETCVGVLDVYPRHPVALDQSHTELATQAAVVAQELLTAIQQHPDGAQRILGELALDPRDEIFMAQGIVMVQLGIGAAEAMSRLRATAFRRERPLLEVARAVLAREVVLDAEG